MDSLKCTQYMLPRVSKSWRQADTQLCKISQNLRKMLTLEFETEKKVLFYYFGQNLTKFFKRYMFYGIFFAYLSIHFSIRKLWMRKIIHFKKVWYCHECLHWTMQELYIETAQSIHKTHLEAHSHIATATNI